MGDGFAEPSKRYDNTGFRVVRANQSPAPAWLPLDIAAACTADIISTVTHVGADPFTLEGSRLASASWLRKNGYSEPGLPDDGHVPIPDTQPPGYFQVRMPPAKNAIILSGPDGAQPQPVTLEFPTGERRRYSELSFLHCTCWGSGTLRVLLNYETGKAVSATMPVIDWAPKEKSGALTRTSPIPAELRVAVTSHDVHPKFGVPVEMFAQRIPADPERVLRSLTLSFESLTPPNGPYYNGCSRADRLKSLTFNGSLGFLADL
jgi:hypothetical protein